MTNAIPVRNKAAKAMITAILSIGLILGFSSPIHASAPTVDKISYEGNGRVEVEFYQDVKFKKAKVNVTDEKGKKHKTSIKKKDDDELVFYVKGLKKGHTYSVKITGVKKEHTRKYGTVKGKFSLAASEITKDQAIDIALAHAGMTRSQVWDLEAEKDYEYGTDIYEVNFENTAYEYDYDISRADGKIINFSKEYSD